MYSIKSVDRDSAQPVVLACELEVRGHHSDYIRNFGEIWLEEKFPARLEFLVTRPFLEYHSNIVEEFDASHGQVRIRPITEEQQLKIDQNPRLKYWHGWTAFCDHAQQLNADLGLLMYADHFQVPLWLGKRSPCPIAANYFRPTFHYHTFSNYRANWKDWLVALRKKWLLTRVLRKPSLKHLYCLDPFAAEYIPKYLKSSTKISHLADVFTFDPSPSVPPEELRAELGIEPDRKIFCLLGVLDSRKGPKQLLESIQHISPEVGKDVCILVLGYIPEYSQDDLEKLAKEVDGTNNVQVVLRNQYIETKAVQSYFELSDVVLTTYQKHMGSSSALVRAALARKPVLSSDFGLMGELVVSNHLGLAVDSGRPEAIAKGIEQFISDASKLKPNLANMERLLASNSRQALSDQLKQLIAYLQPDSNRSDLTGSLAEKTNQVTSP